MKKFILHPGELTLSTIEKLIIDPAILTLSATAEKIITKGAQFLNSRLDLEKPQYGINTGFGSLASQRIQKHQLQQLQHNLILSHATGVGADLSDLIVQIILLLKINSLARGYSGVRLQLIEALLALYNAQIYPCIPAKGSVGASGDLAPLAHLGCALMGVGKVHHRQKIISAKRGLAIARLLPYSFGAKEGLALLNGTQVSTALALTALIQTKKIFHAAIIAGSLSIDAALGSDTPFHPELQNVRGQSGQILVAKLYRQLLENSTIRQSHADCAMVQDPYSLRCQPQVMGACFDHLRFAATIFSNEINAVTDNPILFTDSHEIISGGNFHAQPIAMAADTLALTIAEIGALSERRIALLTDKNHSKLPAFLVQDGGLQSGFMLAHVTASALASENKSLAHPASIDSLPTSANQEDHVSMATYAARRLHDMNENTAHIIAIELLAAAQGIDLRKPLRTSPQLQHVMKIIRQHVKFYAKDRYMAPDITTMKKLILSGAFELPLFAEISL